MRYLALVFYCMVILFSNLWRKADASCKQESLVSYTSSYHSPPLLLLHHQHLYLPSQHCATTCPSALCSCQFVYRQSINLSGTSLCINSDAYSPSMPTRALLVDWGAAGSSYMPPIFLRGSLRQLASVCVEETPRPASCPRPARESCSSRVWKRSSWPVMSFHIPHFSAGEGGAHASACTSDSSDFRITFIVVFGGVAGQRAHRHGSTQSQEARTLTRVHA